MRFLPLNTFIITAALAATGCSGGVTFSSGVDSWLDEGVMTSGDRSRDEAEAFVARLTPGGATNLYDSLKMAFEDEEVDTIFVLSDGWSLIVSSLVRSFGT